MDETKFVSESQVGLITNKEVANNAFIDVSLHFDFENQCDERNKSFSGESTPRDENSFLIETQNVDQQFELQNEMINKCSCTHHSDSDDSHYYFSDVNDCEDTYFEKLRWLEEEQEQLNSSLIALTSHFAQVQLRLKQIVDAEPEEKEQLLKSLEEFAFRGIPDLRHPTIEFKNDDRSIVERNDNKLELQREKQKELISKLKEQLEDLEKYAYETGDSSIIPSGLLLERQSVIIEQLKSKLPLDLDSFDKLSPEELRKQVDNAIRQLVNPVIMKEQLVTQLKTQVTDLERFIEFLQQGGVPIKFGRGKSKCTCNCPLHGNAQKGLQKYDESVAEEQKRKHRKYWKGRNRRAKGQTSPSSPTSDEDDKDTALRIIKRLLLLLQMFTFAQFGCSTRSQRIERNMLKKTAKGNHYGDLRAKLEMAINHILELNKEKSCNDSDYTSDGEDIPSLPCNEKMISAVRKELSVALRDLIEHGLSGNCSSPSMGTSLIPTNIFNWGCFSERSSQISTFKGMTAWDLIIKYYQLKNGQMYNASTARRLSQSYNLSIVGGIAITPKQTLLSTIDDIVSSHTRLKRSTDSHFKAFVSHALNDKKLVIWLRLILKNRHIVNEFYEPWSYASSTGFEDALQSLDKLTAIKFKLPTDVAIRQLQNINEAF
ncbi:RUN domain-containing protein 1-like protein [Leptotrombidium deliense]|uniref:RUN domain-containing protein 1-like protein n=1 Tax=Leptotrombidium deliense TaxID=299467 RepID=A0A443SJN6_9ACAR|nr:RUN domain-containing protein 1-like protein [Leptotrombidium deliense]